jgi:hypothetical protein
MASDRIDRAAIGAEWTARLDDGLRRSMTVRERMDRVGVTVFDMHFAELVRDEIDMVKRIYARFDRTLSPEAETRMRRFLAVNPRDKHGTHRYGLGAAGLDAAAERRRYAAYRERFGVVDEPAGP